jgi:2-succinyl-5-enolpyruvyl-6-hydroxy-3-cyclohexene-1-carboxylate synthase
VKGGDLNALWAAVFLDELARSGVREVCVAPGSRSTPLVLAAASDGRFRLHSVVDERSAGFLALGMGKVTGVPAAVITTSGTAGANLFPAVVEASQGEVPLLVLTADRPHRLRDSDTNQAMDQLRLFGEFPRRFFEMAPPRLADADLKHVRVQACRAVAAAVGAPAGPVHLNFPFEKPLEPSGPRPEDPPGGISTLAWRGRVGREPFLRVPKQASRLPAEEVTRLRERIGGSARGVIVAGPNPDQLGVAPALRALSAATGFPLLADPLSGARFGDPEGGHVIPGYDLFLRSPGVRKALAPDLVLRVGASPTSASLLHYLEEHAGAFQAVVDDGHRWKDHLSTGHLYLRADPSELLGELAGGVSSRAETSWLDLWADAGERALALVQEWAPGSLLEGESVARVVELLPPGASLVVGNSMPIRELDAFAAPAEKALRVFGNRGTSGIDGMVSTTLGVGLASPGPTVGVLGDLALFHDMNGLLALKGTRHPVGFIVVNNDGGGIFHTLPVREHEPAFSRFITTPHGLDFEKVAALYALSFRRVEEVGALAGVLSGLLEGGGPFILEVRVPRAEGHEARRAFMNALVAEFEENQLA